MSTAAEIIEHAKHLDEVRQVLCAVAMSTLALVGEVSVHCSEAEGRALLAFTREVCKPAVETLDRQLEQLADEYRQVHGEVQSLEALYKE